MRVSSNEALNSCRHQVFFCTPSSSLTFRKANTADYLSSYLREHVLGVFDEREVRLDLIRGNATGDADLDDERRWILTDAHNPLGLWQDQAALEHWRVMRGVLPDAVWETY